MLINFLISELDIRLIRNIKRGFWIMLINFLISELNIRLIRKY